MSVVIRLSNVSKTFHISHEIGNSLFWCVEGFLAGRKRRDVKVLDNVSLEINTNDFVGVVGFNGAGKTTLAVCQQ